MTFRFVGSVDAITAGVVVGWVADKTTTDPVHVELLIDGIEVTRGVADQERKNLPENWGNSHHGFRLSIPPELMDGHPHAIAVRVVGTEPLLTPTPAEQVLGKPLERGLGNVAALPTPALRQAVELSVIMPTFNRGVVMEATAKRFLRLADRMAAELVIIDDGSVDDTPDRLRRLASGARNLVTDRVANGGPGGARNHAAAMSRGEILVFVGDDTAPIDDDFLAYHATAHKRMAKIGEAVLGKISWPNADRLPVNFVMSHIQGTGQQQFGYHYMKGYEKYDWRLFYSSNVSVKRKIVRDWSKDGYNPSFHLAAFEDQEFALRATLRLKEIGEDFTLLYVPAAQLVHHHPYTISGFLSRQVSAGIMAQRFLELHPQCASDLSVDDLVVCLSQPMEITPFPIEHYFAIFEGLKSWALVIEHHYGLGQQSWHEDLLKAVFRLAFFEGFLYAQNGADVNLAAGCRYVLEEVRREMHRAVAAEVLGETPGFGLV